MPLVPMRQILQEADRGGYGVGAFNANNMEQIQAIVRAARDAISPVIIQASRGALKYTNLVYLRHLALAAEEENPEIKLVLHLDHGDSLETVKTAIELGFTSVMIDGSLEPDGKTPRSFDDNVAVTREAADYAHQFGVTVEGELGTLGGVEEHIAATTAILTDPEQVKEFVDRTGVDALAVAIGTSHGAYKFAATPKIDVERVREIHQRVPEVFLVMHGASSVPQDLVQEINQYGGALKEARGVPIETIQQAIKYGIRKINVDTDSRLAMTAAIRKVFAESPQKFDPRDYLGPAREKMYGVVKSKMYAFGSAGHNFDYAPMTLEQMRMEYERRAA